MEQIVKTVSKFLSSSKIPYVIVGGVAVPFLGAPRTTVDVDIIIKLPPNKIPGLVRFLKENGFFADEADLRAALAEKAHCTVLDSRSPYRLDIKGVYTDFDQSTMDRRMAIDYFGTPLYIQTPEDAIISKLLFGSAQDIRDARSIAVRQAGRLDMNYVKKMCKKLKIAQTLLKLTKGIEKFLNP
ncbi:MAG: hypothetical protein QME65_05950 [Candidatus Omnitrophota bacterium]|nr:hypothetical protein [Candidatus Omnitrophota bacterium]